MAQALEGLIKLTHFIVKLSWTTGHKQNFLSYVGPTCSCGPCYNNGTCTTSPAGKFRCICLPGVLGRRCQTVYEISFEEDAYLVVTNNYLYDDQMLSFDFKTTLPDGLLLYQEGVRFTACIALTCDSW